MELLEAKEYETIVLGTGVSESILASAKAFIGKTVLHLDEREYYGGHWAAFQLHQFLSFLNYQTSKGSDLKVNPYSEISFDLKFLSWESISNYLEREDRQVPGVQLTEEESASLAPFSTDGEEVIKIAAFKSLLDSKFERFAKNTEYDILKEEIAKYFVKVTYKSFERDSEARPDSQLTLETLVEAALTLSKTLLDNSRLYNLELTIKKVLANGPLVSTFVNSGVSKYVEFKLTNQTELFWDGNFKKIPCSKEDVFVNQTLSLIEKRKLMKFLMFAMDYDNQPEQWQDKKDLSLERVLREDFKLTEELISAVIHCIALSYQDTESITTELGLKSVQDFVKSLGKFGNHSLLWTIYGAGSEIAQSFCRVCALYNGIYILNHPIMDIEIEDSTQDSSDSSPYKFSVKDQHDQVLSTKYLILGIDYLPERFHKDVSLGGYLSKLMVAINEPLLHDQQEVILVSYPVNQVDNDQPIYLLALSDAASACPTGQTLVYLWSYSSTPSSKSPNHQFEKALQSFFKRSNQTTTDPNVVFKISYSQALRQFTPSEPIPDSLLVLDDPNPDLVLDHLIPHLNTQFHQISDPDDQFFPPRFDRSLLES